MNKKIAIPTSNGMLDAHFGHCHQFTLITVIDNNITDETVLDAPPHEPGLLPAWLAERGATDVIAGGMGQRAIQIFNQHKINVFVGAPQQAPKQLVEAFLKSELELTSNYCDH